MCLNFFGCSTVLSPFPCLFCMGGSDCLLDNPTVTSERFVFFFDWNSIYKNSWWIHVPLSVDSPPPSTTCPPPLSAALCCLSAWRFRRVPQCCLANCRTVRSSSISTVRSSILQCATRNCFSTESRPETVTMWRGVYPISSWRSKLQWEAITCSVTSIFPFGVVM